MPVVQAGPAQAARRLPPRSPSPMFVALAVLAIVCCAAAVSSPPKFLRCLELGLVETAKVPNFSACYRSEIALLSRYCCTYCGGVRLMEDRGGNLNETRADVQELNRQADVCISEPGEVARGSFFFDIRSTFEDTVLNQYSNVTAWYIPANRMANRLCECCVKGNCSIAELQNFYCYCAAIPMKS